MRILSLDGGGVRGVLTARILQRLEEAHQFLGKVDLFAGASIGGINALFLAAGNSMEDLLELYQERGEDIFKSRGFVDDILPDEIWRADFAREDLDGVLEDVFGDLTMGRLESEVLIPVADLRSWNTKFYDREDADVLVRDVAAMTSAAPTYWPTKLWSMDGGLFANNPSDSAIAEAVKGKADLRDVICLSVGTGVVPHEAPSQEPEWDAGIKDMLPLLLDIVFDMAVKASHGRTERMLGKRRYRRVNPLLPSVMSLKDVEKIPELVQIADLEDLSDIENWLVEVWGC